MHAVLGMEQQPRSQESIHFLDLLAYVFQVPADAWHGLHYHVIYDPDLLPFRIGSGGLYSHQINPAGESFIHAEILTAQDGEVPSRRCLERCFSNGLDARRCNTIQPIYGTLTACIWLAEDR